MTYTIQRGDTLSHLARRFGTTVDALVELNPSITNPDRIFAGQVIRLPDSEALPPSSPVAGRLKQPVAGRLTSPYGYRVHPIHKDRRLHTGIDWAAPTGTPVLSAEAGTVTAAGSRGGYGLTVEIDHGDGLATLYAHLSKIDVRAGQRIGRGDRLGAVGSTGQSTGPHLHFEVRQTGKPVDPAPFIAR